MTPSPQTIQQISGIAYDPLAARTRLGLITLSTDLTTERDYRKLLPVDCALYTSRVRFDNPTTPANLQQMAPRLECAASLLPSDYPMAAICYSCTAASIVIGDDEITRRIRQHFPEAAVITPSDSAVQAFYALKARRIGVLTPYSVQTSIPVAEYFEARGLQIERFHCMGIEDDREMARVSAQSIFEAALQIDTPQCDALFISCTGLPAADVIDRIEQRVGKAVITSNQATAWLLLQHLEAPAPVGFGRLFEQSIRTIYPRSSTPILR